MTDTELLRHLLGYMYVTDSGDLNWALNDTVGGLIDVGDDPKIVASLINRRAELYPEKKP